MNIPPVQTYSTASHPDLDRYLHYLDYGAGCDCPACRRLQIFEDVIRDMERRRQYDDQREPVA